MDYKNPGLGFGVFNIGWGWSRGPLQVVWLAGSE
jgi:hypothetical protein